MARLREDSLRSESPLHTCLNKVARSPFWLSRLPLTRAGLCTPARNPGMATVSLEEGRAELARIERMWINEVRSS
jgi:hypothetical protein